MKNQLETTFEGDGCWLIVDVEAATARLTAESDVTGDSPVVVMNLTRALANFLDLVGPVAEFESHQIIQVAAVSYATISSWQRDGIVMPSICPGGARGRSRKYSLADAFIAGICGALRRQGASPASLRAVADCARSAIEKAKVAA